MQPFTVAVPDAVLDDLQERLTRSRLPNQIAGIGWGQGTERGFLTDLLDHWSSGYDWRATEARLNAIPQLLTSSGGQRIHLLHARSSNPDAIALLVTHGWPGSVMEFLDVIEPLQRDFHVVAPSLPGFAFSGETSQKGWHPRRIAEAFADVMAELGYERYGLQGGDWGAAVSSNIADLYPDRVIGLHLNMVIARPVPDAPLLDDEKLALDRARQWRRTGTGYQEIQGTRPQSLGYALQDSPAGLAAWIVEKFQDWSDGDIADAYTFDRLLDNVMAYWVTGTAASSLRIYWEMRQNGPAAIPQARVTVPTAVAMFPGEIVYPPRSWTEAAFNVVRWSKPARGGHFAAMEAPAEYVEDVRSFFQQLQGVHGVR
jgi:pimeloyl-ACP methyl ester carboxylesterase